MEVRQAVADDAAAIKKILDIYAVRQMVLERSEDDIRSYIKISWLLKLTVLLRMPCGTRLGIIFWKFVRQPSTRFDSMESVKMVISLLTG